MATPRERARERTQDEIRTAAWRMIETEGAAALSLRAISRELGVVSSAIYRYVPSRDDLLTELIVEAYADMTAAVEVAVGDVVPDPPRDGGTSKIAYRTKWLLAAEAMRSWALRRPAAWGLIYGSPIPGYTAPAERTNEVGTRVTFLFAKIVLAAWDAGQMNPRVPTVPSELHDGMRKWAIEVGAGSEVAPEVVAGAVLAWRAVIAAINSEVYEQLGPNPVGDDAAWARLAFDASADLAGLLVPAE